MQNLNSLSPLIFQQLQYSSMEKELQADLSQMTMYSKIGRYISNKILKYNKKSCTTQRLRSSHPLPIDYTKKVKKPKDSLHSDSNATHEVRKKNQGPSVGYYKVNHGYVDKNPRTYNFNRSVPHFFRDKYFCHESEPAKKDYPDLSTCKPYTKGLVELERITGRDEIKGSVRKFIEDPHENRFTDIRRSTDKRSPVNIEKEIPRDNRMFKSYEFAPEYDYDYSVNMRRLDTKIIPFERVDGRNGECLVSKTGISNCFNQSTYAESEPKAKNWKKMLPREKVGLLPSYMDKNINTRTSIGLINMKTLEMNCSEIRQVPYSVKKKGKKDRMFAEEKQNFVDTACF